MDAAPSFLAGRDTWVAGLRGGFLWRRTAGVGPVVPRGRPRLPAASRAGYELEDDSIRRTTIQTRNATHRAQRLPAPITDHQLVGSGHCPTSALTGPRPVDSAGEMRDEWTSTMVNSGLHVEGEVYP